MRNNSINDPQDPLYRRVQFLRALLWVMFVSFLLLGCINQFLFAKPTLALYHFISSTLALAGTAWLRRRPSDTSVISLVVALATATLLVLYIVRSAGQGYALYWLSIYPPIVFFLLGRTWGYILSILVIGGCLIYVNQVAALWQPAPFTLRSLLNILTATAALIVILRHIEKTRAEAFHYLEKHNQKLEYIATTDPLTSLANRAKLDRALGNALRMRRQNDESFCLILGDIDHFKTINDVHGHPIGDVILIEMAQLLRNSVRSSDLIGRWGGEEFLLVLPNTDCDQAKMLAEKLRNTIAAFKFRNGIHITSSFGVACVRSDDDATSLMQRVDQALYAAKTSGRNRTVTDAELPAQLAATDKSPSNMAP
ncbi:GGDEF domain-containing protein [Pseudidiomarina sediminum]|uniref:GGDEF domain-containing protein n=1 Tax=Pseudidiomarina sediminum TaxID=431675 RepID=UPI001C956369|nr:GGDEF domain-containing protein [Pseudidiomarina sediminum]MBY6064008.1 GGDEF domain-containing protein [Pseudidiomarina sediminum]